MVINRHIRDTACVDGLDSNGEGTKVWRFSVIRRGAIVGDQRTIGQNVMVDDGAIIGNECKIQNNVTIYKGVTLKDGKRCLKHQFPLELSPMMLRTGKQKRWLRYL